MIEIVGIHRAFGIKRVLRGIDLKMETGETVALVGPNGAGKSTLLQVVAGILPPDRGSIAIDGHDLRRARVRALGQIGYAPENADLPTHLRAREWLDLVRAVRRAAPGYRLPATGEDDPFETRAFASTYLGALSLGQRRRLLLTTARMGSPPTLVLDEPTNGLDAAGLQVLETVLRQSPGGALLATHDEAFAKSLRARVVVLGSP